MLNRWSVLSATRQQIALKVIFVREGSAGPTCWPSQHRGHFSRRSPSLFPRCRPYARCACSCGVGELGRRRLGTLAPDALSLEAPSKVSPPPLRLPIRGLQEMCRLLRKVTDMLNKSSAAKDDRLSAIAKLSSWKDRTIASLCTCHVANCTSSKQGPVLNYNKP